MTTRGSLLVIVMVSACAHARSVDQYRTDTETALATKRDTLKACYDQVLAKQPTAQGRVTVKFAVQEKTGRITDLKLDSLQTTAPDEVGQCVLANLVAIEIHPADPKRGEGTWSWDFTAGSAAPPAAK